MLSERSGNINVVTPLGLACLDDCTADYDGDGVANYYDNCPFTPNANQANNDVNNGSANHAGYDYWGDACSADLAGDGYTVAQHNALGKNPTKFCMIMRADFNGDGTVNGLDLNYVARFFTHSFTHNYYPLNGIDPFVDTDGTVQIQRVDVNGDNIINGIENNLIAKYFTVNVSACPEDVPIAVELRAIR